MEQKGHNPQKEEPTISVVLMVKDEKHNMEAYFKTIEGVADELVVVDTGSTDGTLELIDELTKKASFPVRVFNYIQPKFHDGATRQYATEQCRMNYILQIDADERLSEGFVKNVRSFLRERKPLVITVPRVDELVPHYIDIMDYRFFSRDSGARYLTGAMDAVHPHIYFAVEPVLFSQPIHHMQGNNHWLRRPHRIFNQLGREIEEVQNTRGLAREMVRGIFGFYYKFRKVYFHLEARKDGWNGFKYAFLKGIYVFLGHFFTGLKPRKTLESKIQP